MEADAHARESDSTRAHDSLVPRAKNLHRAVHSSRK